MNLPADIVWGALSRSTTINRLGSYDHGPAHWARVRANGVRLAEFTPGCDVVVVEWFALMHDTMRENEVTDPEHGPRAVELCLKLEVPDLLTDNQWFLLSDAIGKHDRGETTSDPSIGVCWDADRLDLPRVGIKPAVEFLSTKFAKGMIANT